MNQPDPPEACHRCHQDLEAQKFLIRVDSDPEIADPLELWICERCMKSMARWVSGRSRPGDRDDFGPAPEPLPEGKEKAKNRPRSNRRVQYTDELDRNDYWERHREVLTFGALAVAAIASLGIGAFFMISTIGNLRGH